RGRELVDAGDGARRHDPGGADVAGAAEREHRVRHRLGAAVDGEVAARCEERVGDVVEVLRRVLHAHDVRVLAAEPAHGRGRDVDGRAAGDVVEDHRHLGVEGRDLGGDPREVVVEAVLVRPDVVRGDDEHAVDAELDG